MCYVFMYFFGFLQTGTRVRKSSLATPRSGPRKKSIVSFDESTTTTIEYAETSESEKKENDEESETSKMLVVLVIIVKLYYSDGESEVSHVRKFSRFNDSMKINKRRMSREEKPIRTENI